MAVCLQSTNWEVERFLRRKWSNGETSQSILIFNSSTPSFKRRLSLNFTEYCLTIQNTYHFKCLLQNEFEFPKYSKVEFHSNPGDIYIDAQRGGGGNWCTLLKLSIKWFFWWKLNKTTLNWRKQPMCPMYPPNEFLKNLKSPITRSFQLRFIFAG